MTSTDEDLELAKRMGAGDRAALPALMTRLAPYLKGYLVRYTGPCLAAEDLDEVINDAFVRVNRCFASFRGDSSLRTWVLRIGKNLAFNRINHNRIRGGGRHVSLQSPIGEDGGLTVGDAIPDGSDFVGDLSREGFERTAREAMRLLPPRQREMLERRAVRNQTYEEIAAGVGCAVGTVKSRLARARLNLRAIVEMKDDGARTVLKRTFNFRTRRAKNRTTATTQPTQPTQPTETPTPMTTYRNNLKKDDRVLDAETKRPGIVANNPRERSRFVQVVFQGNGSSRSVDVTRLRLIVNGQPEDDPPIEGTPPVLTPHDRSAERPNGADPAAEALAALRRERERLAEEMADMEKLFRLKRSTVERIDAAIKALEPV